MYSEYFDYNYKHTMKIWSCNFVKYSAICITKINLIFAIVEKTFHMEVPVDYYLPKLTDHCFLKITFSGTVEETNQVSANIVEVRLRKPHLTIQVTVFLIHFMPLCKRWHLDLPPSVCLSARPNFCFNFV